MTKWGPRANTCTTFYHNTYWVIYPIMTKVFISTARAYIYMVHAAVPRNYQDLVRRGETILGTLL